jgi:hypothetical protein
MSDHAFQGISHEMLRFELSIKHVQSHVEFVRGLPGPNAGEQHLIKPSASIYERTKYLIIRWTLCFSKCFNNVWQIAGLELQALTKSTPDTAKLLK